MARKRIAKPEPPAKDEDERDDARTLESKNTDAVERDSIPEAQLALPVAAIVNLETILVEECSAKRVADVFTDPDDAKIVVAIKAGVGRPPKDGEKFYINLSFALRAFKKEENEKSDPPTVEILCRFVLVYRVPSFEGLSDENLIAFGRTSGVFSAWPYWREFVHSSSFRLSVPPIVLPTYRNRI